MKALGRNDFKSFDYIRGGREDRSFVYEYLGEEEHSDSKSVGPD
jgi:hypothetical protein